MATNNNTKPAYIQDSNIIFVLGAPGSGKGTLCKILEDNYGCYHLSVGDYLRELCNGSIDTSFSGLNPQDLKSYMDKHELVPAENIFRIVTDKIRTEFDKGNPKFLIDGFPRDLDSARLFDENFKPPQTVFLFECPYEIAKDRFVRRMREATDTEGVFDKRWTEYEDKNQLLLERYRTLTETVDTSGETDVSQAKLVEVLGGLRRQKLNRLKEAIASSS